LIGKQLLLKQWQKVIQFMNHCYFVDSHFFAFLKAIDLILQPPELNSTDERLSNVTLACIEYKLSRLVHENLDDNKQNNLFKAKLFSSIKIHGENLIEAVNSVCIENIYANF
jgi:tRNA pseudouridine13 synthase